MKHTKRASMLIALFLVAGAAFATPASAGVSFDFFYSNLNRHGDWIVSASYGRVWQPALYQPGWNPYYDGHWVYTEVGWAWVSDYAWGSIPYHYGTWAFDPRFGWVWVPGYVWAPSWVVFSYGPDYIGWAPVPPRFSIGVSLGHHYCPADQYVFVSSNHFLAPHVRGYAVPVSRNRNLVEHTRIVNNIRVENQVVVNHGPSVREVERWSGKRIAAQSLERVPRLAVGERFSRADLRVDSSRVSRGVQAAEPMSASRALPGRARGAERADAPRGRGDAAVTPRSTARAPQSVQPSAPRGRRDAAVAPRSTARAPQSVQPGHGAAKSQPHARAAEPSRKDNGQAKAQGNVKAKGHGEGRKRQAR